MKKKNLIFTAVMMFFIAVMSTSCTKHEVNQMESNDFDAIFNQAKKEFAISFNNVQGVYKQLSLSGIESTKIKAILRKDFNVPDMIPSITSSKSSLSVISSTFRNYSYSIANGADIKETFVKVTNDQLLTYNEKIVLVKSLGFLDELIENKTISKSILTKGGEDNPDELAKALTRCKEDRNRRARTLVAATAVSCLLLPEALPAIAVAYAIETADIADEYNICVKRAHEDYGPKEKEKED